ncbi:unnamed protein product [Linum tenue]|uniref:Uncharacterized protein n=1 Tax=Linum tenue TaxID=586396 RepID=A0AAV0P2C8_9ROSI|nr:unnamed protein product [Linum tenue]
MVRDILEMEDSIRRRYRKTSFRILDDGRRWWWWMAMVVCREEKGRTKMRRTEYRRGVGEQISLLPPITMDHMVQVL